MANNPKALNVAVVAPIGAKDGAGDAALLAAVLDIRRVLGERLARMVVITDEPERVDWLLAPYGETLTLRYSRALLLNPRIWLHHPDIVAFVGDELLTERPRPLDLLTLSSLTTTLRLMGARLVFYANQVDNLSPASRALATSILTQAHLVLLASPEAVVQLKRQGIANEIFCTASPACVLPGPGPDERAEAARRFHLNPHLRPVFTLCPREFFSWADTGLRLPSLRGAALTQTRESHARFCAQLAAYADTVCRRYDGNVLLLALRAQDEPVVQEVYERLSQPYRARLILGHQLRPDTLLTLLSLSTLQVTSRALSICLSARAGTPAIGLKGGDSLEGIFRQLGMMDYLIDYATFPNRVPNTYKLDEELLDLTGRILAAAEPLRDQMRRGGESLHKRALANRVYFREWVEREFYAGQRVLAPSPESA